MMTSILVELSFVIAFCGNSDGQKVLSARANQQELSLNRSNDKQHISAKVGQPIVATLQTIGGGQYDTPQISSRAIRFESVVFAAKTESRWPDAGLPFHCGCRGRSPSPNPAHRFKPKYYIYDSGHKTLTDGEP